MDRHRDASPLCMHVYRVCVYWGYVLQPVDRPAAESNDAEGKLNLYGAEVQQTVEDTLQAGLQPVNLSHALK